MLESRRTQVSLQQQRHSATAVALLQQQRQHYTVGGVEMILQVGNSGTLFITSSSLSASLKAPAARSYAANFVVLTGLLNRSISKPMLLCYLACPFPSASRSSNTTFRLQQRPRRLVQQPTELCSQKQLLSCRECGLSSGHRHCGSEQSKAHCLGCFTIGSMIMPHIITASSARHECAC